MSASDAEKWNAKYADREDVDDEPTPFLVDNLSRLGSGSALVLAAGCGRNAVFLAQNGFDVTALDISDVGLARCRALAESRGTSLETVCVDLDDYDPGYFRYDLITMIYFYQPGLFPAIRSALKPGGYFFFHTFSAEHANVGTFGPRNPDYLANPHDLFGPFGEDRRVLYEDVTLRDGEDTEAVIRAIIQRFG